MSGEHAPGAIVADRYRLDRLLGEGGMGSVWAATHQLTRHRVALKFLKPEAVQNAAAVRRFMREARAATSVNHPNVIQVHDIFQLPDGAPVMVMDLLAGESLGQKLVREGRIALPALARIMVPVISAVGTAHSAGIVHRDLKPDNIFLALGPDGSVVPKVLDFGIAKLNPKTPEDKQSAELTRTGALLGTPYYMSPEQVFGEKDVDARSDVWSIGVILYEALTGVRPVDGDNLGQLLKVIALGAIRPIDQVAPDLPLRMREAIGRMLTPDREKRAPSLQEAFDVLKTFTNELAQSFSEARQLPIDEIFPPGVSQTPSGASSALTPNADLRGSDGAQVDGLVTSGAFAKTGPGNTIVIPTRKMSPLLLGLAAVGAIGLGVLGVSLSAGKASGTSDAPAVSAALSELGPAVPTLSVVAGGNVEPPAAPSASEAPSAATTVVATVAPSPSARAKGKGKEPAATASPNVAPSAAVAPPPNATATTPAGMATVAPF